MRDKIRREADTAALTPEKGNLIQLAHLPISDHWYVWNFICTVDAYEAFTVAGIDLPSFVDEDI